MIVLTRPKQDVDMHKTNFTVNNVNAIDVSERRQIICNSRLTFDRRFIANFHSELKSGGVYKFCPSDVFLTRFLIEEEVKESFHFGLSSDSLLPILESAPLQWERVHRLVKKMKCLIKTIDPTLCMVINLNENNVGLINVSRCESIAKFIENKELAEGSTTFRDSPWKFFRSL